MSELVQDKDYLKYLKYKMKYTKLKKEMEGGAGKYLPSLSLPSLPSIFSTKAKLIDTQKNIRGLIADIKTNKVIYERDEIEINKLLSIKKKKNVMQK